uniref:Uncharacterized protein n=1 Tax=Neogobius melanostomus TaxID=47308 RepID=A0A8C6UZQ6_9GOBI
MIIMADALGPFCVEFSVVHPRAPVPFCGHIKDKKLNFLKYNGTYPWFYLSFHSNMCKVAINCQCQHYVH